MERCKFGISVRNLKETNPELYQRVKEHLDEEFLGWTPGQIQSSVDGDYGDPDPRIKAAQKAWGDFAARGGTGPHKR